MAELKQFVDELRLVKDDYEIEQMRGAVAASVEGFNDVLRALPWAMAHDRGERVVESAFFARARMDGNDLGYETIAASGAHACILHWTQNDGPVKQGDLLLLDAGVELESLYTADVTRTIPVSGHFNPTQRKIYEAVLEAADAAFAIAALALQLRQTLLCGNGRPVKHRVGIVVRTDDFGRIDFMHRIE